jgi:hypothetical protein
MALETTNLVTLPFYSSSSSSSSSIHDIVVDVVVDIDVVIIDHCIDSKGISTSIYSITIIPS